MKSTASNPTQQTSLLATLQRHRGGKVLEEASAELAKVVAGVMATGKPGSLTVTLNVKVASRGQNAVTVTDKVTSKVPLTATPDSFWFANEEGALLKDDPRQREMKFAPRTVEGEATTDGEAEAPRRAVNG